MAKIERLYRKVDKYLSKAQRKIAFLPGYLSWYLDIINDIGNIRHTLQTLKSKAINKIKKEINL